MQQSIACVPERTFSAVHGAKLTGAVLSDSLSVTDNGVVEEEEE